MSTRKLTFRLSIAFLAISGIAYAEKKVTICHVPPGNAANRQTISVGEASVSAHLAHGDQLGACPTACPASCDDGNACTSDSCDASGQCRHEPVSCDDGNACTRDECDTESGCLRLPNDGQSCDDQNDCTSADACTGTECRGTAIAGCCATNADCDDRNPCTIDSCTGGSCANPTKDCSVPDKCLAGFCNAAGDCDTAAVSCDDSNVCTDDRCDPAIGCSNPATMNPPEPSEVSCSDTADNDCDGLTDGQDSDCFVCGNGILEGAEQCDDGNTNPFDGCDQCIIVDTTPD
jgi:cysteine-rich repeat protein